MTYNAAAFGPMFILGLFNLSDQIPTAGSLYIEHGLSNLMIPAYLLSIYELYGVAVFTGDKSSWYMLAAFTLASFIAFSIFTGTGTEAMYYLRPNPNNDDRELIPSIFYILKWTEHAERTEYDPYSYPYAV